MYRVRSNLHNFIMILLDMIAILLSLFLANFIRHYRYPELRIFNDELLTLASIIVISYFILYLVINFNNNFTAKGPLHELFDIIKMNLSILAVALIIMYFTRIITDYSRLVIIYFCLIDPILMALLHTSLKKLMPAIVKQTTGQRQLLVVTKQASINDLLVNIKRASDYSYQVRGIMLTDTISASIDMSSSVLSPDACIITSEAELISICKTSSVDEVLFCLDLNEMTALDDTINQISSMGIAVHISVDLFFQKITSTRLLTRFDGYIAITYADRFLSFRQLMLKRSLDILGGLVGMLLLIPITIIIAPAIKMESRGPIFFSQKRVGRNGRVFKIYKFRSMYTDAEERKKDLMKQNEMNGLMFKMEDDPRITKVGKFIRKTSLDEFPQFYNVLKGDMSLVGTRPPTLDEYEQYEAHHKKRLSITPGLTGFWQVNGRNQVTDFEEVVKLDVKYIEEWTFGLDLKILLKTVGVLFKGK